MLRAGFRGIVLAAVLVPATAAMADGTTAVGGTEVTHPTSQWTQAWDPTSAAVGNMVNIWLEGSPSTAWGAAGESYAVTDQWGGTHTVTGCTAAGAYPPGSNGNTAECWSRGAGGGQLETNAPNQHGPMNGSGFATAWLGSDGTASSIPAQATITNVTGNPAAPQYGDTITMSIPESQWQEWLLRSSDPFPGGTKLTNTCTGGELPGDPCFDGWSDFSITLVWDDDYGSDFIIPTSRAGWLVELTEATGAYQRVVNEVAVPSYAKIQSTHIRANNTDFNPNFNVGSTKNCAWNDDVISQTKTPVRCTYWKPGFRQVPATQNGVVHWEACDYGNLQSNPLGDCWADAPEAFDPATGYIRAGDNLKTTAEGSSFDSYAGFGELLFGAPVPEPGTALLLGAGLIGLASIYRRN